jgi:hypothetical protein
MMAARGAAVSWIGENGARSAAAAGVRATRVAERGIRL